MGVSHSTRELQKLARVLFADEFSEKLVKSLKLKATEHRTYFVFEKSFEL